MHYNYLMYQVIDKPVNTTDIMSEEIIKGIKYIYYTPWFTTFSNECEYSWWMPKPKFNYKELRHATMLEF